ncbi:MAG: hypothetical protein ACRYFZ_17880 [Janthinobacterium lividum]
MSQSKQLFTGLLVAALLGTAGYAYYWAQARQSATLARITALETRLMASNQQRARAANQTIFSLGEIVSKNHNQAHDMAVFQQAQQIQDSTQLLLAKLHQLRQLWQSTANKPETGTLPAQVDRYASFIQQFVLEMPSLTKSSAQTATVGWLGEFDMATEPQPARLAQLTKLETQVRQEAVEALESQARKVGSECICFDKIAAFAMPTSETVAPGALYEAQLVLMKAASSLRPTMSADEQALLVDPAGQGLVRLRVPRLRPGQPDTVRAQWHGLVRLRGHTADTMLAVTVPYFIVKAAHP